MSRKYFGTDGVRGRVGEHPITPEFVMHLGWAAGKVLSPNKRGKVVIGKDTRISGYMFESALQAGLSAAGMDVVLLGPLPTPAIAYMTRTLRAQAGVVISASHNDFHDNGIKFFSSDGFKLPDEVEHDIEALLDSKIETVESEHLGKALRINDAQGRYIEFCKGSVPATMNFSGLHIVLDCGHGATYHTAPNVFRELGAKVETIGVEPDGLNINRECGSTCLAHLQAKVVECGADMGIAFDGDGDRVMMVDHKGGVVDGDEILYIITADRLARRKPVQAVVGTLMSNLGLEQALAKQGVELLRAKVGDRYVIERMKERDLILGGESSGHIICLDRNTTGDGIVSALQAVAAVVRSGNSLHALKSGMSKCPQTMINVRIAGRVDLSSSEPLQEAVRAAEAELADDGRVLLRPSGTEPLIRVMVEGNDAAQVETVCKQLADVVREQFAT